MTRRLAVAIFFVLTACAPAATPPAGVAERYSGDAAPDAALSQRILIDTYAYWDALASSRWQRAYEQFTYDYREKTPFGEWRNLPHTAWARQPQIVSIHWTKGAHRQHGPDLYAIVEWTARAGSSGSEGALIWRQEPDGTFLLERTVIRKLLRPKR